MGLMGNITINVYSFAILLVLLMQGRKKASRNMLPDRLFIWILQVTALLLVLDTLGRFDGRPDTIYPLLNHAGNFFVFLLSPVPTALWIIYVCAQVRQEKKIIRRLMIPCLVLLAVHTLLVIGTQFTGWFYTIDAQNIYRRGPLYVVSPLITLLYMLAALVMIVHNRERIEKSHYLSLLLFPVPPFLAMLLHISTYGISIVLDGVVLSILIVFVNVQNKSRITDYLTGAYNREGLDLHLKQKIRTSTAGRAFSAILLDFDHFKHINDTYGHDMGDRALQISVKLLRECIGSTDLIARFGGDEFAILLDTADKHELEAVVKRINHAIEKFDMGGSQPFTIGFSIGYAVYDASTQSTAEDFLKLLDQMMYQMKQG